MKGNLDMAIEMKKEQFTTKTEIYLLEFLKLITKKVILYIKEKGFWKTKMDKLLKKEHGLTMFSKIDLKYYYSKFNFLSEWVRIIFKN